MRSSLPALALAFFLALIAACAESEIPVDFQSDPSLHGGSILVEGPPEFAVQETSGSTITTDYRLSGTLTVMLDSRPPQNRDEAHRHIQRAVQSHKAHVTRTVLAHIDARTKAHGGPATPWHSSQWMEEDTPAALSPSGLQATYEYALHVRARPELVGLLAPGQRDEIHMELEIAPSWWGDLVSTARLQIEALDVPDAFLPTPVMANDGLIDIAIHVGRGHEAGDGDSEHLDDVGRSLLAHGWGHPSIANYGRLTVDSGPFIRSAVIGNQNTEFHVTLVDERPLRRADGLVTLSETLRESLASRDVVILRNLDLQSSEQLAQALRGDAPSGAVSPPGGQRAQLLVLDGHFLSSQGDRWVTRGASSQRDILSMVASKTAAESLIDALVEALTVTDGMGRHIPVTFAGVQRMVEQAATSPVHWKTWGLEDNPTDNPYGAHDRMCAPCASGLDCGAAGNLCVGLGDELVCGVGCASHSACPNGSVCARVFTDPALAFLPKQCVPRTSTCSP